MLFVVDCRLVVGGLCFRVLCLVFGVWSVLFVVCCLLIVVFRFVVSMFVLSLFRGFIVSLVWGGRVACLLLFLCCSLFIVCCL